MRITLQRISEILLFSFLIFQIPVLKAQEKLHGSSILKAPLLGWAGLESESQLEDWNTSLSNTKVIHVPGVDVDLDSYLETKAEADRIYQNSLSLPPARIKKTQVVNPPVMSHNWQGNPYGFYTPNDNHIAVSNAGIVISVINANIRAWQDTNLISNGQIWSRTLQSFVGALMPGNTDIKYDPRVIYDPKADRFIIVFLVGANDASTKIPVAFSKTPDPREGWNIYLLSGNPNEDGTWTDYPQIGITDDELFITGNSFTNPPPQGSGQSRYSLIWQIDKIAGFQGSDSLDFRYFQLPQGYFSPLPAVYGSTTRGPEMYFISTVSRPQIPSGTVRLHMIDNTIAQGGQLNSTTFNSPLNYRVAASANQPGSMGRNLNTNDCRVQGAFIENEEIHFVLNSGNDNSKPSVYYGIIRNIKNTPEISAQIITHPTLDIGYPAIAFVGTNPWDYSAIISVLHSGTNENPGTSAFFVDIGNNPSDFIMLKKGDGIMNTGIDGSASTERWGDYMGIARYFPESNIVFVGGSYGQSNSTPGTWIAKVNAPNVFGVSLEQKLTEDVSAPVIFPNPANEQAIVEFNIPLNSAGYFSAKLYDSQGLVVKELFKNRLRAGVARLVFNTERLPAGKYIVRLEDDLQVIWEDNLLIVK